MACRSGVCSVNNRNKKRATMAPPANQPQVGPLANIGTTPRQGVINPQMNQQPAPSNLGNLMPQMSNFQPVPNTINTQPNRIPENESWAGLRNLWQGTKEFFGGTNPTSGVISNLTPQQQFALNTALMQYLQNINPNAFNFEPIANQARQNFGQNTIPSIAERFTSMGAQKSSAFPQLLGQAGADLDTNLAALSSQHGLQSQGLLQNLLQLGLRPQLEHVYQPGQPGALQGAIGGASAAATKYALGGF